MINGVLKRILFGFLALIIIFVWSCSNDRNSLAVTSTDYADLNRMEAGAFDEKLARSWYDVNNPYWERNCHISYENGVLLVQDQDGEQEVYSFAGDNGYFLGIDMGEFDGWVRYYPYHSEQPEAGESVLVVDQNAKGFCRIDNRNAYLFTADYWAGEGSFVYRLRR